MVLGEQGQVLKAAVLGSPIAHSLSPVLHGAAYAALGLDSWTYERHEVLADGLAGFVGALGDEWRGLSLTMPLKEAAFDVAATVTDIARDAEAINTLVRRDDGGWDGANTDVAGIVAAVSRVDHGGAATILGSGATARSAALALVDLGVTDVLVSARSAERAGGVLELLRRHGVRAELMALERWADDARRLVISTLPPEPSAAVGASLDETDSGWDGVTLLDVVYADWPTPLARAAMAHGAATISGLDMLVHQAAAQVALFTGERPPIDVMFAAAREATARP